MKRFIQFSALSLVFFLGVARAAQSPVALLQGVTNQMIVSLEHNKSGLSRPGVIHAIVRRILIPHIDLNRMSASVVGPSYWRQTSARQRQIFIREFTDMVIATYSNALASYDRDRVLFYPLRGGYAHRNTVRVNSLIVRSNGQKIPLSYNLIRSGGSWRVYDFSIENVSIVQSYQAQFSGVLSGRGMSGLIQRLIKHNRGN
jgi:phospholipid transport system substrate-binding protein